MKLKIEEQEITISIISCLILIIIGYITKNYYNGVSFVIFSVLLVKNIKNTNKKASLYIKRVILILLLIISFVAICMGY